MISSVRPAAVAGVFYPASASALEDSVSRMLAAAPRSALPWVKAIIAPHAGYIYSGAVAASIYAPLRKQCQGTRRIILLGPTHRVAVDGLAIPSCSAFVSPLGRILIDQDAIAAIRDLPQIVVSDAAHAEEHALEVQLPFLQTLFGDFSLLPLAVGRASPEAIAEVLDRLWGDEETLIVVSSDLSHYLDSAEAQKSDARTAQQIVQLDPAITHQQACGASPVNGLLLAARKHRLQAQQIALRHSGEVTGDNSRVVGYGAFAFFPAENHVH